MARHIMAVCVVCLLCADRLPCQQHVENGLFVVGAQPHQSSIEYQQLNARVDFQPPTTSSSSLAAASRLGAHRYDPTTTTEPHSDVEEAPPPAPPPLRPSKARSGRVSRHAAHSAAPPRPEITGDFLHRLFAEYGQGDGTISIGAFQRMLRQLGLHQLVEQKYAITSLRRNATNEACIPDTTLVQHVQDKEHTTHALAHPVRAAANCSDPSCADDEAARHDNYTLSEQDMLNLCPVLLYQLASPLEAKRAGCIERSVLADIEVYEAMAAGHAADKDDMFVWIYSFISVFACGILGLVGVAIIPFMDSRYYNKIIQFLVSLAVGTMTGDALLHLLPHSLAGQSESNMIYKGLTCMGGIVFFYITEHGFTMISEWRKRIAKKETKKPPSRAKVVRDPDSSVNNSVVGDKLCKSKYSSYPYCYDEIAMETKNDVHMPTGQRSHASSPDHGHALATLAQLEHEATANNVESAPPPSQRKRNGRVEAADAVGESAAAAQSLLSTSHNNYAPMTELGHQNHHNHVHSHPQQHRQVQAANHQDGVNAVLCTDLDSNSLGADSATTTSVAALTTTTTTTTAAPAAANGNGNNTTNGNTNGGSGKDVSGDTVTVILREHESSHHGHSHKHGHVHSPPASLSAVAWMIIMGDGLHNFTDGMAIGAAFAENIAGGFSTSLAVFCHELPHELGDFAILMKAGMSVKSAVYYNLLTGILSFIGMIVGIVFGQSPETAQWMFAAAAGLFIYIALVDMMPELSSSHKSLEQFTLQVVGMCSGISLMLLIAIYEGDLMNVFASTASGGGAPAAAGHQH